VAVSFGAIAYLMTTGDLVGMSLFSTFGLWWLLLPQSVAPFYTWFFRGKARLPGPRAIRILGAAWIALVAVVTVVATKHPH